LLNVSGVFYFLVNRPAHIVSQTMIYFKNKNLHAVEQMLLDEKRLLDIKEEELKKRRGGILSLSNVL
jgi:hypothetical protein